MESDFILYVDFDATLCDTPRFAADLLGMIATNAHVPAQEVTNTARQFVSDPVLGGYDYAAHTASYGLDTAIMWHELDTLVKEHDYLYPDSAAFIQSARRRGYNPHILSFGEERFQLAKIVPVLPILTGGKGRPLEVTVVDRKKHEHIRALHPGQSGVLIDDVPNQDLPAGFTEVHIDRNTNLPGPVKKDNGYMVSDLAQAQQVVDSLVKQAA